MFLQDAFDTCFHHILNNMCFLFHRLMVKELGETFWNIINSLVEAGQKLSCHDTTVCGVIFVCNRFCNFVLNIFLKSLLYYDIS